MSRPPSDVVDVWYHIEPDASRRSPAGRRTLVRSILSGYLRVAPDAIVIDVGPHGKPFVRGTDLQFSVSRDARGLACAVARGAGVGIDVELPDAIETVDHLLYVCSPRERSTIELGVNAAERARLFLRLWTRKEAVLKAWGVGFLESAPEQVDTIDDLVDTGERSFRVVDVDLPGTCCAVARQGSAAPALRLFVRDHDSANTLGFVEHASLRSTREAGAPQGNATNIAGRTA